MSFDWNPFKVTTIVIVPKGTVEGIDYAGYAWHCDSCGGSSHASASIQRGMKYPRVFNSLDNLWQSWIRHVNISHDLTPVQTEGWSTP